MSEAAPHPPYDDVYLVDRVAELLAAEELPGIVQAGHPALRTPALPYRGQLPAEQLTALIALMRATMHAAPGVGLAAPQLGLPLQLAVVEDEFALSPEIAAARERAPLPFLTLLNPRYTAVGDRRAEHYEGCLSVSGWQAVVSRPAVVDVTYDDVHGTARARRFEGWQARILQHETDHLRGELYLDHALTRSLASNAEYARHWAHPGIAEARAGLHF